MTGETSGGRSPDAAGFVIAAALIALALIIAWDAGNLGTGSTYSPAGPSAAAYAVAAGLALLGLATAFTAWRGDLPERESFDVMPVLIILGGLGALTASIYYGGGFILGTTIMFAATSRALGHPRIFLDLAIGFSLSLGVYLVFTKLLSLSLPQGPLERLF
jgi:putative tricarboxylic transport membrane protein